MSPYLAVIAGFAAFFVTYFGAYLMGYKDGHREGRIDGCFYLMRLWREAEEGRR